MPADETEARDGLEACGQAFAILRGRGLDDLADAVKLRAARLGREAGAWRCGGESGLISTPAIVDDLRSRIDECLARVLPSGTAVALVGFPDHWNAGDSAIWCGELAALARLGCRIVHQCDQKHYSADVLRRQLGPDDVVCLHGGGNLGDLWPVPHAFRETIMSDFPGRRIVQLPQSLHFQNQESQDRFRELVRVHGRFELLVRDRQSLGIARDRLGIDATLCPDLALAQGMIDRPASATRGVVWLSRTDHEARMLGAVGDDDLQLGVGKFDWIASVNLEVPPAWATRARLLRQEIKRCHELLGAGGGLPAEAASETGGDGPASRLAAAYEALARLRQQRGLEMIAAGEILMTDRLHGHILALLMGVPSILMDNSCGKVRSFFETWTSGCCDAFLRDDAPSAAAWARACLDGLPGSPPAAAPRAVRRPPSAEAALADAARTTIVTACRNRAEDLGPAIRSWLATRPARIIVCDWGSSEPLTAATLGVAEAGVRVDVIRREAGDWVPTWAFNDALCLVETDYVLKLDCDHSISPDFFCHNPCRPRHFARGGFCRGTWGARSALLCDMSLLRQAGFFDERITTRGFEDVDLYRRLADRSLSFSTLAEGTIHLPQSIVARAVAEHAGPEACLAGALGWKTGEFLEARNRHLFGLLRPWGQAEFGNRSKARRAYHGELGASEAGVIARATVLAFHEGLVLAGRTSSIGTTIVTMRSVLAEAGPAASSPLLPFLVEGGGQALFVAGPEPFHELGR